MNPVRSSIESPPRHSQTTVSARRPGVGSLVLLASIVVSLLASSSAPTPLYATYARMWGFSPITTTVVFGVYAIAVLLSLLIFGRVSDHIGRRPVLLGALGLQTAAMAVLTTAQGLDALFLGRVLQGLSTGGALGALGAAMLDVDRRRGTLANAVVPGVGTGMGALLSGSLVQYAPAPTHLVYLVLIGVFVVQGAAVICMPETVGRTPGVRAALRPELTVPSNLRGPVLAAAPILFAVWALAGFYGSLGPALARQLSGSSSTVVAGLGLFLLAVTGSLAALTLDRAAPRTVMLLGIALLAAGSIATLAAVDTESTLGFFSSTIIAGAGFGAGYQGGIRTVVPRAAPHERAGVLSVLFVVCYLGLGVPSAIAGALIVHGTGLITTARDYTLFIVVLAGAALAGLLLTNRSAQPVRPTWTCASRRASGNGSHGDRDAQ
ncbi:MFS transporter [Streptomyces sp. CoH27]|uniref:MFS transporter n=1 Tax=Streptomyces sp. CoH27 TaxID=2875763 RepID=UPI001CD474B7|nr:MFS transporter [Streptomyces sp. CoH27]